jgi:hypothetical protein
MGKWFNWMMWGITYPFLGALLSAVLMFLEINYGYLWQPQLAFLGINGGAVAIVGAIGAILTFVITILVSVVFWLLAGLLSVITTPVLSKGPHKGSVNLIFGPWLLLSLFILMLNLAISSLTNNPVTAVLILIVNFVISLAINYACIWVSVWINGLLRMQRYLPA